MNHAGGWEKGTLALFLLGRGGGLGGLGLGHALLELIDSAGGIDELLLAGVEGMAGVADTDNNDGLRGSGLDHIAAGTTDFRVHILRMNLFSHKRQGKYHLSGIRQARRFSTAPSSLL